MILLKYNQFITEASRLESAKKKAVKAADKIEKFDKKKDAAELELQLRNRQINFEQEKQDLKNDIKRANSKDDKNRIKEKLRDLEINFRNQKLKLKSAIKNARN